MKKILLSTIIAGCLAFGVNAQDDYNKWSLEINGGFNKPMAPLSPGYFSPTLNLGHVDFGVRYMFNDKFGAKLDYGLGSFSESGKDNNPAFSTSYYRLNLQGIANLGRIMKFESFTRRINLLGHLGAGIGQVQHDGPPITFDDNVYNIITGITTQVKLSEKIALTGDISTILNGRQTVTFDGNSNWPC
jgi:OOP family OmpA-OmpF porin